MKKNGKMIGGILLLAVLSGLFVGVLALANAFFYRMYSKDNYEPLLKSLTQSVGREISHYESVRTDLRAKHLEKIMLSVDVLGDDILESTEGKPCFYGDGAVIRVEDGKLALPEGFPADVRFDAKAFDESLGTFDSFEYTDEQTGDYIFYTVTYFQLTDSLYYIEWEDSASTMQKELNHYELNKSLMSIENAFDIWLLIFPVEAELDGTHFIIYASDHLPPYYTAEEYGITPKLLSQAVTDFDSVPPDKITGSNLTIDGKPYEAHLQRVETPAFGCVSILAYLIPMGDAASLMAEQFFVVTAVILIVGILFLVWLFSTRILVRRHSLNDSQKRELHPRSITRRSLSFLGVGCLIVMAAYALTLSLFRLYSTCQQVNTGLLSMRQRIQENQREADYVRSQQKKDFEECALLIAQTLEKHPEYATQENLQELCYVVEAEYIMLFDDQGNETLSNARYLNLSLGRNPSSATYEFRRLLTGTPLITREPAFDEATGENNALIGVSMEQPGKGSYGALLLAVAPDQIDGSSAESVGSIMSSLVAEDMLAFSVSAESGLIVNASDGALEGGYATDLGLPERALRSGYRDFFKLNGLYYYGECEEYDGALYYYAAKSSHIYRHVLSASLIAAAGAFGLMTVLALYMLLDYRRFFAEHSEGGGEALAEPSDMVWLSGGRRKYSRDPAKRWRTGVEEYGIRAPMHLTRITFEVLMTLFIVAIAMMFLLSGSGKRSIITFILRGQWARGVNLFALTNILITLGELFLTVTALKLLLRLISAALGARGETVCRLLTNLVSYAGVIIFVYVALYDLGFNPGTLLASLGLLSFAVSLGAKDLLTDVIAGLSIVFEGDYQVGDIIEVSGYRGEVLEIGVRTTKLEGRGGNIKIIYNRDVKNIVNMTRKNSWCVVELGIDSGQNLDEVERMLTRALPAIGEANPKIISGPVYKGFSSITKGVVSLSIIAECNEADYFSVQRALCRALQEIFSAHNIKLI